MSQKAAQSQKTHKSLKASRDAWVWKGVADRKPLLTINPAKLEISTTPVTSTSDSELVSSYSWLNGNKLAIVAPGCAPTWKPPTLPITLPPDAGSFAIDHNAARLPRCPFEPLFRAAAVVSPALRFDDVDVVINRNSLRKLLDLCRGRVEANVRLNLLRVHNTLVVERCERKVREKLRGGRHGAQRGWGHGFEQRCVHFPPGTGCESSLSHHRALRYKLGDLDCVVQFEVDACYEGENPPDADAAADSVPDLSQLSIAGGSGLATHRGGCLQRQATMAEIKSSSGPQRGGVSKHMPQLWFGRTPWLLVGRHTNGTFHTVSVAHAAERFADWDAREANQATLRALAALLARLRDEVLQRLDGNPNTSPGYLVAICQKKSKPRTLQLFAPTNDGRQALPDGLVEHFWSSST